ncbi:MAG: hypothetical protein KZQ85_10905 [Candidatus Thiodiazotropha sp. (ex Myrtea sp. 'scaly one' KF741663)]|nr:hypothetical protein [Candidatus Thiodiazotropha sp. (ex Myrtea sp. 'scaly one' KF741663)]
MKLSIGFMFTVFMFAQSVNAEPVCEAYQPYTDGCTDYGIDDINFVTDFEGACNTHDICYQTIGRSRDNCDTSFRNDLLSSCEDKYLKFEAWRKIGTKDVIKLATCFSLLGPYECHKITKVDIFDWIEVSRELAERIIELPLYPVCLDTVGVYEGAVRTLGESYYENNQRLVTTHAEQLARNQLNGSCPVYTSADNSNLFSNNSQDVTRSLYMNILGREPTSAEYLVASDYENSQIDWEYHVTSDNSRIRTAVTLVPILAMLLN